MKRSRTCALLLAVVAATAPWCGASAQDHLKVAVGARGVGETFVAELGQDAGIFKKHGLTLDVLYTQGGGETQQVVIANSAQIGVAAGFLGTLGAYAKGAPIRVIGSTFTGGSQLFWYVPASSPIKSLRDTDGKTVAYSTNGSSTHTAVLALQKSSGAKFKPTQTGAAPATLTQVMSGQIDVGWAGAPFGVDAVEQGKIRVIAKASDDPVLDRQTIRLLIANLGELTQRKDVIVRFMRAYREALDWVYATPEGLKAYAAWSSINEATARRALQEFLPKEAVNPDRMSGLDDIVADAVTFKYIPAPFRVGVANAGAPRRNWHAQGIARIWRKPGAITAIQPKSAPATRRRVEGADDVADRRPAADERSADARSQTVNSVASFFGTAALRSFT